MIFKLLTVILFSIQEPKYVLSKGTASAIPDKDISITSSKLKANDIGSSRSLMDFTPERNKLIETYESFPEMFILSFKITPTATKNEYLNIFRFTTTDGNCCHYGDRWLTMWFHPNSYRIHLVAGQTNNGNQAIDPEGVEGNKENEIKIVSMGDTISLSINGVYKGTLSGTNRPMTPETVMKLYISGKHHNAAVASITDWELTPLESPDKACLPKSAFDLYVSGCGYSKLLTSIQQTLSNPDPQTHEVMPCYHSASTELEYHLPNVTDVESYVNDLCKQAQQDYAANHEVPWSEVTQMGDKFDKEYYDGNGDWNEEHQSNYPHPPIVPGQASNVLNRDAERVDDLYETHIQRYPLQWPGDAPTSMTNFENCELQAAMCCWVSDRQANDNNGNCATPYDQNCLDADPGDNTDLCAVDMARSVKDATHVDDGFAIFPEGDEGPVHCHGFAWGEDEREADFRYRANNLFYVSMSDHLHDRGYVRNVQGAPMCSCVENMPIVSRSDCTEITAKEFYKFSFPADYTGEVIAVLDYVDLNFNACKAKKNNNLQRFYERLKDEGRVSKAKYHRFRNTIVGDNQCSAAIGDLLFEKGMKGKAPEYEDWTILYGRGSMISADTQPELWNTIKAGSYIRRICKSCSQNSHKDIIYKRLTGEGEIDFRDLFLGNWFSDPAGDGKNVRGTDFNLFSSFESAFNNQNPWTFCNYNDDGIGFPRDCGPNGHVGGEWNSMRHGGETDFAFFIYTGSETPVFASNLALNGSASQSSTDYGGVASRAIDGNTNGNWGGNSVTHTAEGVEKPWWKVDLGVDAIIERIVVWNRKDGWTDRLTNCQVQIIDSSGAVVDSRTIQNSSGKTKIEFEFDDVIGATVKIQKLGQDGGKPFSLAEVQVFGFVVDDEK